jgi:hypothetical protein
MDRKYDYICSILSIQNLIISHKGRGGGRGPAPPWVSVNLIGFLCLDLIVSARARHATLKQSRPLSAPGNHSYKGDYLVGILPSTPAVKFPLIQRKREDKEPILQ